MTKTKSVYLALLAVLLSPMAANADLLYATVNFNEGDTLVTIDTDTQVITTIGNTGLSANFGLADYNGRLFGFDQVADLVKEIDPATGATLNSFDIGVTTVGEGAIAIDSNGGGFLTQCGLGDSWTFGLTPPSSTALGAGVCFDGADFNSANTLYGLQQFGGGLYTIDTTTNVRTLVGLTGIELGLGGLTFGATDNLYAINSNGLLFSIDAATGLSSLLFDTGLTRVSGLSALQGTLEVPEPGTLALLGIGLLGMGLSRRKKA